MTKPSRPYQLFNMAVKEYIKEQQLLQQFLEKVPVAYRNGNLLIAYYAAYPRVFTPDMLYQLLANFNTYEIDEAVHQIHYIAISDLLLSDLCTEISHDLFEMNEGIQKYLLTEPAEYFGKFNLPDKKDIAAFTCQYAIQFFNHPFKKNLKDVLYWKALAILAPELMGTKIVAALEKFKDEQNPSIEETQLISLLLDIGELQEKETSEKMYNRYAVLSTDKGDNSKLINHTHLKKKVLRKGIVNRKLDDKSELLESIIQLDRNYEQEETIHILNKIKNFFTNAIIPVDIETRIAKAHHDLDLYHYYYDSTRGQEHWFSLDDFFGDIERYIKKFSNKNYIADDLDFPLDTQENVFSCLNKYRTLIGRKKVVDALFLYNSPHERIWLVNTEKFLICLLYEKNENRSKISVFWEIPINELTNIEAKAAKRGQEFDTVRIATKPEIKYSTSLFLSPFEVTQAIRKLTAFWVLKISLLDQKEKTYALSKEFIRTLNLSEENQFLSIGHGHNPKAYIHLNLPDPSLVPAYLELKFKKGNWELCAGKEYVPLQTKTNFLINGWGENITRGKSFQLGEEDEISFNSVKIKLLKLNSDSVEKHNITFIQTLHLVFPANDPERLGEQASKTLISYLEDIGFEKIEGIISYKRTDLEAEVKLEFEEERDIVNIHTLVHFGIIQKIFKATDVSIIYADHYGNSFELPFGIPLNLTNLKLQNIDLEGIDFSFSKIAYVSFQDANLSNANFEKAKIANVNFQDANLSNANFEKAKIAETRFEDANLENCSFEDALISDCDFSTRVLEKLDISLVNHKVHSTFLEKHYPANKLDINKGDRLELGSGTFKVIEKLGEGREGVIYRIENIEGKDFVIKVFKNITGNKKNNFSSDIREFEFSMGQLKSPYIASIFVQGRLEGHPYILRNFYPSTLKTKLKYFYDEEKLTSFAIKLLQGLSNLHEHKVIHNDVKPDNILVDNDDNPIIIDFLKSDYDGIYTVSSIPSKSYKLGFTVILGTVGYIAPERFLLNTYKRSNVQTDIFSFGVTMYEILSGGRHPFFEDFVPSTKTVILKNKKTKRYGEYIPIEKYRKNVSSKWKNILKTCLKLKPEERFLSVKAISEYLEEDKLSLIASNERILFQNKKTIKVSTQGFNNVIGLQFSIDWDKDKVKTNSVKNFHLHFSEKNISINKDDGVLRFLWSSPTGKGITIVENTNLFEIEFERLDLSIEKIPIKFSNTLPFEAVNEQLTKLTPSFYNGSLYKPFLFKKNSWKVLLVADGPIAQQVQDKFKEINITCLIVHNAQATYDLLKADKQNSIVAIIFNHQLLNDNDSWQEEQCYSIIEQVYMNFPNLTAFFTLTSSIQKPLLKIEEKQQIQTWSFTKDVIMNSEDSFDIFAETVIEEAQKMSATIASIPKAKVWRSGYARKFDNTYYCYYRLHRLAEDFVYAEKNIGKDAVQFLEEVAKLIVDAGYTMQLPYIFGANTFQESIGKSEKEISTNEKLRKFRFKLLGRRIAIALYSQKELKKNQIYNVLRYGFLGRPAETNNTINQFFTTYLGLSLEKDIPTRLLPEENYWLEQLQLEIDREKQSDDRL